MNPHVRIQITVEDRVTPALAKALDELGVVTPPAQPVSRPTELPVWKPTRADEEPPFW